MDAQALTSGVNGFTEFMVCSLTPPALRVVVAIRPFELHCSRTDLSPSLKTNQADGSFLFWIAYSKAPRFEGVTQCLNIRVYQRTRSPGFRTREVSSPALGLWLQINPTVGKMSDFYGPPALLLNCCKHLRYIPLFSVILVKPNTGGCPKNPPFP